MSLTTCRSTSASAGTLLSFDRGATLAASNLGGLGPDFNASRALRFNNVGTTPDGHPIHLEITNTVRLLGTRT